MCRVHADTSFDVFWRIAELADSSASAFAFIPRGLRTIPPTRTKGRVNSKTVGKLPRARAVHIENCSRKLGLWARISARSAMTETSENPYFDIT